MGKKCTKCGAEISGKAKFCPVCGAPVEEPIKMTENVENEVNRGNKGKILAITAIAVAVLAGSGYAFASGMINKTTGQEETTKVKRAKQEAAEKTNDANEENQDVQETQQTPEKKETTYYKWIVKPKIEADEIFYPVDSDEYTDFNEYHKQYMGGYAFAEKDGLIGIMDQTAAMYTGFEYSNVVYQGGADDEYVVMKTPSGEYYGMYIFEDMELDKIDNGTPNMEYEGYDWDDEESISDVYARETENLTNSIRWNAGYYYDGEVRYVHTSDYGSNTGEKVISGQIPIRQADHRINTLADWLNLSGKYAIASQGELLTDFVYDECGSESEGLFAVKQNGKWGYVDETGKIVIPIEFDASWNKYTANEAEASNVDIAPASSEYCYAASNGYVNLRKDNQWKLCDLYGNEIIPFGVFEEILPVDSNNICWVKQNGKWGTIQIQDTETESTEYEEWKEEYINWVNRKAEKNSENTFQLFELNADAIPEIISIGNRMSDETAIATYGVIANNGLNEIAIEKKPVKYDSKKNTLMNSAGNMDQYHDTIYTLRNGYWEVIGGGNYGVEDSSAMETDANGNPVYKYWWSGEEVTKEEYDQKVKALIDIDNATVIEDTGVSASEVIRQIQDYKSK